MHDRGVKPGGRRLVVFLCILLLLQATALPAMAQETPPPEGGGDPTATEAPVENTAPPVVAGQQKDERPLPGTMPGDEAPVVMDPPLPKGQAKETRYGPKRVAPSGEPEEAAEPAGSEDAVSADAPDYASTETGDIAPTAATDGCGVALECEKAPPEEAPSTPGEPGSDPGCEGCGAQHGGVERPPTEEFPPDSVPIEEEQPPAEKPPTGEPPKGPVGEAIPGYPYEGTPCGEGDCGIHAAEFEDLECARYLSPSGEPVIGCTSPASNQTGGCTDVNFFDERGRGYAASSSCDGGSGLEPPPEPPEMARLSTPCEAEDCGLKGIPARYVCLTYDNSFWGATRGCHDPEAYDPEDPNDYEVTFYDESGDPIGSYGTSDSLRVPCGPDDCGIRDVPEVYDCVTLGSPVGEFDKEITCYHHGPKNPDSGDTLDGLPCYTSYSADGRLLGQNDCDGGGGRGGVKAADDVADVIETITGKRPKRGEAPSRPDGGSGGSSEDLDDAIVEDSSRPSIDTIDKDLEGGGEQAAARSGNREAAIGDAPERPNTLEEPTSSGFPSRRAASAGATGAAPGADHAVRDPGRQPASGDLPADEEPAAASGTASFAPEARRLAGTPSTVPIAAASASASDVGGNAMLGAAPASAPGAEGAVGDARQTGDRRRIDPEGSDLSSDSDAEDNAMLGAAPASAPGAEGAVGDARQTGDRRRIDPEGPDFRSDSKSYGGTAGHVAKVAVAPDEPGVSWTLVVEGAGAALATGALLAARRLRIL